jgi:hypothetical protein
LDKSIDENFKSIILNKYKFIFIQNYFVKLSFHFYIVHITYILF